MTRPTILDEIIRWKRGEIERCKVRLERNPANADALERALDLCDELGRTRLLVKTARRAAEELIDRFAAFDSGLTGWYDDCVIPKQAREGLPITSEMGGFVVCRQFPYRIQDTHSCPPCCFFGYL